MKKFFKWLSDAYKYVMSKPWYLRLLAVAVLLFVITSITYYFSNLWAFRDRDPNRGALAVANDVFGDKASSITYLDQGWEPKDSLWFDNVTQGSDLVPYDFFLVLEGSNGQLFRSNENMNNRYRYLVRTPTINNPDGLPIGFVKDNYLHKNFFGFTCAACHTNQINYNNVGIRIDGAPAMSDMDTFLTDLAAALRNAQSDPAVQARFIKNVLALGHYGSADDVKADLKKYALRLTAYRVINKSDTHYGFARLDAFGRIYNQVLEYVMTVPDIDSALAELVADGKISQADLDKGGVTAVLNEMRKKPVLNGTDRDRIMETLTTALSLKQVLYFRNKMFNAPNAPVSYPFLWDIPQHDYVQWNGVAANAGLGPIGRNTGEVIGVFGTMDWSLSDHWTLAGVFSGQGMFNSHPLNFHSSVNVHNLALIEDHLKNLWSPQWPQNILPKLDMAAVKRGAVLFDGYCASCHAEIDRTAPGRRVVAHMSAQDSIKTDPAMAVNSVGYQGYSGIVRNSYVGVGPGNILLDKRAPVAALLIKTTTGVVATPDADKWWGQRFAEWLYDVIFSLRNNNIGASMKNGDYHPDTTQNPLASVVSYKGRSLDGIWATAPYLHNGSVPTLYDLLLPAAPVAGDAPGMEYRPTKFMTGSREFDPVKVGFKTDGYNGFQFLTNIPGNSNAGHEFGTRDTPVLNSDGTPAMDILGKPIIQPALTKAQRMDLVEYLKSQ
jgi:mono/diheme cytochrome c family protein